MTAALPLRAVDSVEVDGRGFLATKTVTRSDPYLHGHFPELTIYPGVFTIESVQQAVTAAAGEPVRMVELRSARFLVPLLDGDVFTVEGTLGEPAEDGFEVAARCRRRDDGVLVATVKARFQPVPKEGADA